MGTITNHVLVDGLSKYPAESKLLTGFYLIALSTGILFAFSFELNVEPAKQNSSFSPSYSDDVIEW